MNDKAAQYVKMLKANVDRGMVVLMFVILGVMIVLWYMEQDSGAAAGAEESGRPANLEDKIPKNPYFKTVKTLSEPQELSRYPEIEQVSKYNMFEYKSVKQKEVVEREANQKYEKAKQAVAAGQPEEARRLIEEILGTLPTHQKARELQGQLKPSAGGPSTTPREAVTTASAAPPAAR
jgi:hypothetical protein